MIDWITMDSWSPYVVGAGIGVLSWIAFLLSDRPPGASTAFAKSAGMIESAINRENADQMSYYQKIKPKIDWQWMIVFGMIIGSLLSSFLSGRLAVLIVPPIFAEAFGADALFRFAIALIGGILIGLGARWADGCTSGHGISGTLQLSLVSWIAVVCFFVSGIAVAALIFGLGIK